MTSTVTKEELEKKILVTKTMIEELESWMKILEVKPSSSRSKNKTSKSKRTKSAASAQKISKTQDHTAPKPKVSKTSSISTTKKSKSQKPKSNDIITSPTGSAQKQPDTTEEKPEHIPVAEQPEVIKEPEDVPIAAPDTTEEKPEHIPVAEQPEVIKEPEDILTVAPDTTEEKPKVVNMFDDMLKEQKLDHIPEPAPTKKKPKVAKKAVAKKPVAKKKRSAAMPKTTRKRSSVSTKTKKVTKKRKPPVKEVETKEATDTLEDELEQQLTPEEIDSFQIEKMDMDKLTHKVSNILVRRESEGMLQAELYKKLKLSARNGARLSLKLERMGLVTRKKLLSGERWTYQLTLTKTPISTESLVDAPCLKCPYEQRCTLDGEISPRNCRLITEWVMVGLKRRDK